MLARKDAFFNEQMAGTLSITPLHMKESVPTEGNEPMDFQTLYKNISPRLKTIARRHNGHGCFIDEEDLYQEMCIYLWNRYKDGVPEGIKASYIIRGCEFHLLNYLRKKREKALTLNLEEPIGEDGGMLKDVLADTKEPIDRYIDKMLAIEEIKNNGFTEKEKEVFSLLLNGYTVREAGNLLGISHVMVLKYKKRIIKRWRGYQKGQFFT